MYTSRARWATSAALAFVFLTGCRSGGMSTASWWPWKSSNNELASSAPVWQQQLPSSGAPAQNLTGAPAMDMTASTSVYPMTAQPGAAPAMAPQQGPYAYADPNAAYAATAPTPYPSSYPMTSEPAAAVYPDPAMMAAPTHVADNRGLGDSPYGNPAPMAQQPYGADPYAQVQPQGGYLPQSYAEPAPAASGAYPASYSEPNAWPAPATPPAANYSQPAAYPTTPETQPYGQPYATPYQQPAQPAPAPSYGAAASTAERPWRPGGTTDYVPRAGSNLNPAGTQMASPAGWNQPATPNDAWPTGGISTTGATLR